MAGGLKAKGVNENYQTELLSESKVNPHMKRDLVSHASKAADLRDFQDDERRQTKAQFEHGKTLLSNRGGLDNDSRKVEEDLRSLRSEYDYGSKKKFVDVLGNVTTNSHLNRLRQEHAKNAENYE